MTNRVTAIPVTPNEDERYIIMLALRMVDLAAYQRDHGSAPAKRQIAAIRKEGFSVARSGLLTAAPNFASDGRRLGEFRIVENDDVRVLASEVGTVSLVDGGHRYYAAMFEGFTHLEAFFYPNWTYERQAAEFALQDKNSRGVGKKDKMVGMFEASDPKHLRLRTVCKSHGFDVLALPVVVHDFAFKTGGSIDHVDNILGLVNEVWEREPKRTSTVTLSAIDRLLLSPEAKKLDFHALKKNLVGSEIDTLLGQARNNQSKGRGNSVTSGLTNVLIEKHNFKKESKNRLSYID